MAQKRRRSRSGRRKKLYSDIFIDMFLLVLLIPTFFSLSFLVGCGYLFAFFGSLYHKTIFKKKHVARLIVIGSLLAYISGAILQYGFNQSDEITFLIIIGLGILIWIYGYTLRRKGGRGR